MSYSMSFLFQKTYQKVIILIFRSYVWFSTKWHIPLRVPLFKSSTTKTPPHSIANSSWDAWNADTESVEDKKKLYLFDQEWRGTHFQIAISACCYPNPPPLLRLLSRKKTNRLLSKVALCHHLVWTHTPNWNLMPRRDNSIFRQAESSWKMTRNDKNSARLLNLFTTHDDFIMLLDKNSLKNSISSTTDF